MEEIKTKDDKDEASKRFLRYVETGDEPTCFQSKNLCDARPYYNGQHLESRMSKIRESIVYIRQHWDEYDSFVQSLKSLMSENDLSFESNPRLAMRAKRLFNSKKNWKKSGEEVGEDMFDALRLYTSVDGYNKIFRFINALFREEGSIMSEDRIRSAVFLVELINIDLFNYCLKFPSQRDFSGTVYRGILVRQDDMDAFNTLRHQPVDKRFIAVPLSLLSATKQLAKAKEFVKCQMDLCLHSPQNKIPLMYKVHVKSLRVEYLDYYRRHFPSVVSTICAVDIQQLSDFAEENEVLLRGPFFQFLEIHEWDTINGSPCHVVEVVMLNRNRDHISSAFLGDLDGLARAVIETMSFIVLYEYAIRYYDTKDFKSDVEAYTAKKEELKKNLKSLMDDTESTLLNKK